MLGFKQAQNILILINRYLKYAFFVIRRYVYLTLTFDLDKGHNFILSFGLQRVYAFAYLDEKKDETCILN